MRQCLDKRNHRALSPINTDVLSAAPYHCLARSLARAGDLEGAEKAFQAGMNEKGREDEIKLDYARFLKEQNRPVDALHRLHEVVAMDPGCLKAWHLGAEIALSQHEFLEVACDWTSEALKQFPNDNTVLAQRAEVLLVSRQPAQALSLWQSVVERDPQARSQAAVLFCELVEDLALSRAEMHEPQIGPISRSFIDWYQRCLNMQATELVNRVNERLDNLRSVLPATAGLIETALSEASIESAPAPEPCLA
jgi:tetratricopeptide (TPR) repeat protein